AWEAREDVPRALDADFLAPPHQLNVLKAGHALVHQLQHVVAEALDARLNLPHAATVHLHQLLVPQIRFHLVEQLQPQTAGREPGKQGVDVAHVEDVVDASNPGHAVLPAERRDFHERAIGALAAERHRLAVETAERAVVLGAPPAAARGFDDDVIGRAASD